MYILPKFQILYQVELQNLQIIKLSYFLYKYKSSDNAPEIDILKYWSKFKDNF